MKFKHQSKHQPMHTDLEWEINSVKQRYHWLQLDDAQANEVFLFESGANNYSSPRSEHFSFWEELEYQLNEFEKFLSAAQFKIFEESISQIRETHENAIRLDDKNLAPQIKFEKQLLSYYKKEFLPSLYKQELLFSYRFIATKDPKIILLKTEFEHYVDDFSNTMLVRHFRDNRRFAPKRLELISLQAECRKIWPDYSGFKSSMDNPTRSVADFVYEKYGKNYEELTLLIESRQHELTKTISTLYKKYIDHEPRGWTFTVGPKSKEEINENFFMTLLLARNFEHQQQEESD